MALRELSSQKLMTTKVISNMLNIKLTIKEKKLQLTINEQKHYRKKKRTQLKYENKTHNVVMNASTVVVQKGKKSKQIKLE